MTPVTMAVVVMFEMLKRNSMIKTKFTAIPSMLETVSMVSGVQALLISWKTVALKPHSRTMGTLTRQTCRQASVSRNILLAMPSTLRSGLVSSLFTTVMTMLLIRVAMTEACMVPCMVLWSLWLTVPVTMMPVLSVTLTNRPRTRLVIGVPELIVVIVVALLFWEKPLMTTTLDVPKSRLKTLAVFIGSVQCRIPA